MVRFDQKDKKQVKPSEVVNKEDIKKVKLKKEDIPKLKQIIFEELNNIKIDNESLVPNYIDDVLYFNQNYSLSQISDKLQIPELSNRAEFVKNIINHNIDKYIGVLYGKGSVLISEPVYTVNMVNEFSVRLEYLV